jgi:cellulose synthase/poly-beta-1,6-N-acetylglucosamine synthase-like glycosyltransferase
VTDQRSTPPWRRRGSHWIPATCVLLAAALGLVFWSEVVHANDVVREASEGTVTSVVAWGVRLCLAYVVIVFAAYGLLLVFAGIDSAIRNRQRSAEDFDRLETSRFTIPVSIISCLYNEEPGAVASTRTLLAQDYPEIEVLVIDDGSTDGTFERLEAAFDLERRELFYRHIFETRALAGVYRSRTDPRLTVVRKLNGGKADALNCGLNFARYRYVLGVDGDTMYRPDALLHGMRLVMRDPARIVGVTSTIAISFEPEVTYDQEAGSRTLDRSVLSNLQHLDYLRAFLNNRLAWSRLRFMLCTVGAFHIWRRDLLEEVGGFSPAFTCEDIEMTFRIHEKMLREKRPYEILCVPETVATTEGPARLRGLVKQRARWQRVIMETLVSYRRMFGNKKYGTVGIVGVPFYMITEVVAPLFEAVSIVTFVLAAWLGVVSWPLFAVILGLMAFSTSTLTSCAILLHDRTGRDYPLRALVRLILIAPLDLFLYRPVLMWARARGTWDYLRGRKDWDKFERNLRAPLPAPPGPQL